MLTNWCTALILLGAVFNVESASVDRPAGGNNSLRKLPPTRLKDGAMNKTSVLPIGTCEGIKLCCPGRIDGCVTPDLCYCDEFCMENEDCCSDYPKYCQGKFRCWEVDSSNGNPCNKIDAGATCSDSTTDPSKLQCSCSAGYVFVPEWNACSQDVCGSNPCNVNGDAGASCAVNEDLVSYSCVCSNGFWGVDCSPKPPCLCCKPGHGLAKDGKCVILDGCLAADPEDKNPCNNGGDTQSSCSPSGFSYECSCSDSWSFDGNTCVAEPPCVCCQPGYGLAKNGKCIVIDGCMAADFEDSNPCNNEGDAGSSCSSSGFSYECSCSSSWNFDGLTCKKLIPVDPLPCLQCGENSFCEGFKCVCNSGYTMVSGICLNDPCKAVDSLDGNPCNNNGEKSAICNPNFSTGTYTCTCSKGWISADGVCIDMCSMSDPEDDNPCNNQGDSEAVCYMAKGSYSCSCSPGWIFTNGTCAGECAIADPSDANPCNNDGDSCGVCQITSKSYKCQCSPGFQSVDGKCVDINECLKPHICSDCGGCHNTVGGYFCVCGPGYSLTSDGKGCISQLAGWLNLLGLEH